MRARAVLVTAAAGLGAAVLVAAPAHALGAPGGLGGSPLNTTTHVLSWSPVNGATGYQVQVDDSSSFSSPVFTASTVNTRVVPTKALPSGDLFWRVRSASGSTTSAWSTSDLTQVEISAPSPLSPIGGEVLAQPQDPPLLQWSAVQGATSYTVQVDGNQDMIGAKTYTTKSTSLVDPDPLTAGDWWWTVTASKGSGLNSLPTTPEQFVVQGLPAPQIVYPVDDINQTLEDVVFDWTPVAGAKTYDLQVALDADFNNIALTAAGIQSTRYSPATTLNSDQFWWRVRAVDPAGQQSSWTSSLNGFKRLWPEAPTAVYPTGTSGTPGNVTGYKQYYQWTPARHATRYQLQVSTDVNFSPGATDTCTTAQTTYTPHASGDCSYPSGSAVFYWRVRPLDLPYPNGLPGIFSTAQAFTYTNPGPVGGQLEPQRTGHRAQDRRRRQRHHQRCPGLQRHQPRRHLQRQPVDPGAVVGPGAGRHQLPRLLRAGRELHDVRDPGRPVDDQHDLPAHHQQQPRLAAGQPGRSGVLLARPSVPGLLRTADPTRSPVPPCCPTRARSRRCRRRSRA